MSRAALAAPAAAFRRGRKFDERCCRGLLAAVEKKPHEQLSERATLFRRQLRIERVLESIDGLVAPHQERAALRGELNLANAPILGALLTAEKLQRTEGGDDLVGGLRRHAEPPRQCRRGQAVA